MNTLRIRGFTLIEIMVVVTIVVLLAAIGFGTLREQRRDAEVQAEAERLAAFLRQARNRAVAERAAYGVVFNIRNAVGTSGAVLNNWDGGHYYRMIGPGRGDQSGVSIPVAGPGTLHYDNIYANRNFPHFIENVANSWVSEAYVLPERTVRFLALGDTDEGPRVNGSDAGDSRNRYYGDKGETTYPRPWFGFYDESSGRLWPWGGYDSSKPTSGFYYQGENNPLVPRMHPPVVGSVHPQDRIYNQDWNYDKKFSNNDVNGDGDIDDLGEQELGFAIWRQGEPRSLVEADWMDACIMFTPAGTAKFLEWNRGRRAYWDDQMNFTGKYAGHNGIADRAKRRLEKAPVTYWAWDYTYTTARYEDQEDHGEVGHFVEHNSGWHITLAPDVVVDDNRFNTVEEAMQSIDPAWRIFIGTSGVVRVMRVQNHRSDSWLNSKTPWPENPADWLDTTSGSSNKVWRECRLGWLHEPESQDDEGRLKKTGTPITDILTPRMMTDKIWWIQE